MAKNMKLRRNINSIIIMLLFISLAFVFVLPLAKTGVIFTGDDISYHVKRINEMALNLQSGNFFTGIYTHTFQNIGYPLNLFYPWLTLIPFAILKLIVHNSVFAIYLGIAFYTFLTLCFTYLATYKFDKQRIQSVICSILYTFCAYRTINIYTRFALGEFIAMSFLPIAFYGFYAILKGNFKDWPYLAFGLSAIMLSHVLTTLIVVLVMIFIFLIFALRLMTVKRLGALCKSVIVFLCSSFIFIGPFLEQELFQAFNQPSQVNIAETALSPDLFVWNSFSSNFARVVGGGSPNIGITLIVILGLVSFGYKKMNSTYKTIYFIGLITSLASTKLVPWSLLAGTPFDIIQFPWRLLGISSLMLSLIGAKAIYYLMDYAFFNKKEIVVIGILIVVICPWLSSIQSFAVHPSSNEFVYTKNTNDASLPGPEFLEQYTPRNGLKYLDSVKNHTAIIDGMPIKLTKIKSGSNSLSFTDSRLSETSTIDLPVFYYKNINVFIDNHAVKVDKSFRNTLKISGQKSNKIVVKYVQSIFDKFSIWLSITTWIIGIVMLLVKFLKIRRG